MKDHIQIGGHVGTEQAHTTVCVNCDTDREPHAFYFTRNCELAVAVCEPCSETYVYDRCVHCHQQTEITDLTEGPVYKHFDEVPAYFPSCDPCYDQGIKDVEREVREHVEGVTTTTKTITREEFAKMSKPTPPVRVNESFYPTAPYSVRVTVRDGRDKDISRTIVQVVGYAPNPDIGHLEAQVLDSTGSVVRLGDWVEESTTLTGHEDSDYRYYVEVITSK